MTKRSTSKVVTHLTKKKDESPFAKTTKAALKAMKKCGKEYLLQNIQPQLSRILTEVCEACDRMIDDSVENEEQKAARTKLTENIVDLQERLRRIQNEVIDVVERYVPARVPVRGPGAI